MDRRAAAALLASLALIAGCEAPLDPSPGAADVAADSQLAGASDRGDGACARRVDIYRETRARVSTGPGSYMLYPDAKQTMYGPGWFVVSEGVSDGFSGNGTQSWVKQSTNVECSSWSIGHTEMLVMTGSGTGHGNAEATFKNVVDDKRGPDAHSHSLVEITFEIDMPAELKFQARMSGQAYHEGGLYAGATLIAYVRRLEPLPAADLVKDTQSVDGDDGSVPTKDVSLAGVLAPGRYRMWVGIRKEGWVAVYPTYPLSVGYGASEGKWAFQFTLKEGP